MDDSEKLITQLSSKVEFLEKEVLDIKSQTKLNSEDIQNLNLNIVRLTDKMDGLSDKIEEYSESMKDLAKELKTINEAPKNFNDKVKIGAIVAIITYAITALSNYILKR